MNLHTLVAEAVEQTFERLKQAPSDRVWLSPAETASYLGCTTQHLQNLRARRKGPPFVKFGRKIRYGRDALDSYLRARLVQTDNSSD